MSNNLEEFDAFTNLKALRELKKQLEAKSQVDPKAKPVLQYLQKQQPLSIYDLRIQFQQQLARLNDLDTRQVAFQNIYQLIQSNQSQTSLSLLISCLQTPTYTKGADGIIKTVTMIVGIYGTAISVQDVYKLQEVVMKFFNDGTAVVQQACAECWSSMYTCNIYKRPLQQRTLLMYQTLVGIIGGGGSRQSQETGVIVLATLFEALQSNQDITFIKDIIRDYFNLFNKSTLDHPSMYIAMTHIVQAVTIQSFANNQVQLIDKTLQAINNSKFQYRTRVAACNLIRLIGLQYQSSNFQIVLGKLYEQVIVILDDSTRDRIIAVQNAARAALKEWMKLKLQIDTLADMKQFNNYVELDLQTSDGFLKKKSGTGGGQVFVNQSQLQRQPVNIKQLLDEEEKLNLDQTQDYNQVVESTNDQNIWIKAYNLDSQGQTEEAVVLLLMNGDDLYLLRLLLRYREIKTLFDRLSNGTALQLVDALLIIFESDFLNVLCLDFVQNFIDNGLQEWFKEPDYMEYLNYFTDQQSITAMQCKSLIQQLK